MALAVEGLRATYGDMRILHGVSLVAEAGEVVALVGANGAGKTTTLNAISGLQASITGGRIHLDGVDITHLPPHRRVEMGIAHVPQGRHLFPLMTVRENLEMGAFTPKSRADMRRNLETVCEIFPRLGERMGQNAGSLSGGEQQMCAIARGIMSNPRYLLLDEPSLGLAPIVVKTVMAAIRTIVERGIGVFLVEQNVVQALKLASRAYVIEHGAIVLAGSSDRLLGDDDVRKAYLGM